MREKPDFYTEKARREGYPARSVYKLEEIQNKFRVFRPGNRVLDVGASPGSWSMYVDKILGGSGTIVAVDLNGLNTGGKPFRNAFSFFQGDVFSAEIQEAVSRFAPFSVIMSDAAPSTSGNRLVDSRRSYDLVERVILLSDLLLDTAGNLVVKIFQGGDERELFEEMRKRFSRVKAFKPEASRKISFETYFIGLGKGISAPG